MNIEPDFPRHLAVKPCAQLCCTHECLSQGVHSSWAELASTARFEGFSRNHAQPTLHHGCWKAHHTQTANALLNFLKSKLRKERLSELSRYLSTGLAAPKQIDGETQKLTSGRPPADLSARAARGEPRQQTLNSRHCLRNDGKWVRRRARKKD